LHGLARYLLDFDTTEKCDCAVPSDLTRINISGERCCSGNESQSFDRWPTFFISGTSDRIRSEALRPLRLTLVVPAAARVVAPVMAVPPQGAFDANEPSRRAETVAHSTAMQQTMDAGVFMAAEMVAAATPGVGRPSGRRENQARSHKSEHKRKLPVCLDHVAYSQCCKRCGNAERTKRTRLPISRAGIWHMPSDSRLKRLVSGLSVSRCECRPSGGRGQEACKGDLFRAADEKLYEAKRTGRNRVAA
jgi:hypothetical protein